MLGIRTGSRKMVGVDESTDLRRPPTLLNDFINVT